MKTYTIGFNPNKTDEAQITYFDEIGNIENIEYYDGNIREGYTDKNAPNWGGIKFSLLTNQITAPLIEQTNPHGFTIFTTYLSDGQNGLSSQNNFPTYFNMLGLTLTDEEKVTINQLLTDNKFTAQL